MNVQSIPITSREQWLSLRPHDATASDLGALFGLDPRKSPRQLYEEKASGVVDDDDNDILRRGRWQEAAVAEMLAENHPEWQIEKPGDYLRDPELRLGATTDRVATLPGGEVIAIECKSVVRSVFEAEWPCKSVGRSVFDSEWHGCPPERVVLQALGNAMLRNVKRTLVAVLVRDAYIDEPHEFWVDRHAAAEAKIAAGVREFWRRVEANDPPPFDYSSDRELIAMLYREGGGEPIDLSHHNRIGFLCEQKLFWMERRRHADGALCEVDAEIAALLGDAERALHPEYNVTLKSQRTGGYTVPVGSTRVLRVTRKKQAEQES